MTQVLVTEDHLCDIAAAIRSKNGEADRYTPGQMAAAIRAIAPDLTPLEVGENGVYTPPEGAGFGPVTVNIPGAAANVLEGSAAPDAALGQDGDYYIRHGGALRGTSGSYFNTGYYFKANSVIKARFMHNSWPSAYPALFGVRTDTSGQGTNQWYFCGNGSPYYAMGGGEIRQGSYALNTPVELECGYGYAKWGDYSYTNYPQRGGSGTLPLYLFVANLNNSPWTSTWGDITLYYLDIYEDGALVKSYSPATDEDGVACLYESVEGEYLYNLGSGSVTVTRDNTAYVKVDGAWQVA